MDGKYFDLLKRLHPLHRTLVSDGTDKAMEMVIDFARGMGVPEKHITLHKFPSGSEVSTWIVPKKYTLKDYRLVQKGKEEKVIIDSSSIPLSVAEYSRPVDRDVSWDELKDHLFYSEKRPDAIPFVFRFFYKPGSGFCISKSVYDGLDRKAGFRMMIDSEFTDDFLKCLEIVIPGETEESILVMSNICHPYQVNDSITGVINSLMLIEHFMKRKNHYTLRFGFWPEHIGAQAYFSKYIGRKSMFRFAVFTEMLGTKGGHLLQFSRQENTLLDRAAVYALEQRGLRFSTGRFAAGYVRNDERVSNGVNLDIPTISLTRWPYEEYHTSDDNPSIIDMKRVRESSDVTRDIIEMLDSDRILVPGNFFGQPFLTRYGLFREYVDGPPERNPNKIMEDVFTYSDGRTSLLEIALRFNYPWASVMEMADGLVKSKLFSAKDV
jgi:aminopeptidase-like protein